MLPPGGVQFPEALCLECRVHENDEITDAADGRDFAAQEIGELALERMLDGRIHERTTEAVSDGDERHLVTGRIRLPVRRVQMRDRVCGIGRGAAIQTPKALPQIRSTADRVSGTLAVIEAEGVPARRRDRLAAPAEVDTDDRAMDVGHEALAFD